MKKFSTFPLSGTGIFPIIAVSIIRRARYRKAVVEKLHTKFQNISEYSLRGLFNNVCYNFYTLIVSFLQCKGKKCTSNYLCSHVLSVLQLLVITSGSRYIFVVKQNFTHIEHDLSCQIFCIIPKAYSSNSNPFGQFKSQRFKFVSHRCQPFCSDYGCRIHTDVTIFAVPLGDTDSTSLLSYSQRHYDI